MSEERSGIGFGNLFMAFATGAAVGAFWAYLTAPRAGAETQARLRASADGVRDKARRVPGAFEEAIDAARTAFLSALERDDGPEHRMG